MRTSKRKRKNDKLVQTVNLSRLQKRKKTEKRIRKGRLRKINTKNEKKNIKTKRTSIKKKSQSIDVSNNDQFKFYFNVFCIN